MKEALSKAETIKFIVQIRSKFKDNHLQFKSKLLLTYKEMSYQMKGSQLSKMKEKMKSYKSLTLKL